MHTPQSDPMPPTWVLQQAGHILPPGTERKGHTQSSEDHNGRYFMDAARVELK